MSKTILAPNIVGVEYQRNVGGDAGPPFGLELGAQLSAAVDARVSRNPKPLVEIVRLGFAVRLQGRMQRGVTETDARMAPNSLAIWTTKSHRVGHPLQQLSIDRRAVEIE